MIRGVMRGNIQKYRDILTRSIQYRNYSSKLVGRGGVLNEFQYYPPPIDRLPLTLTISLKRTCHQSST